MDRTETASDTSSVVDYVSVATTTQQRSLFTEPLLGNGYCVTAYFAVIA
jgi:hypothetical protein